jgi:hypothetical protein
MKEKTINFSIRCPESVAAKLSEYGPRATKAVEILAAAMDDYQAFEQWRLNSEIYKLEQSK